MQTVCDTLCAEAEVETVLYFCSLATTMNTWRFSLRAKLMTWIELRGAASSMLHASRQPPTCLSRSWGAADDAEKAWCFKEAAHQRTRSPGALDVEGDFDATSCRENVPVWNCLRCSSKSRATCMLTPGKSKQ